jgi:hypothetical protein
MVWKGCNGEGWKMNGARLAVLGVAQEYEALRQPDIVAFQPELVAKPRARITELLEQDSELGSIERVAAKIRKACSGHSHFVTTRPREPFGRRILNSWPACLRMADTGV